MSEEFCKQISIERISRALQVLDALGESSQAYHAQQALTDLRIYALRLEGHCAALQDRIAKASTALGAKLI